MFFESVSEVQGGPTPPTYVQTKTNGNGVAALYGGEIMPRGGRVTTRGRPAEVQSGRMQKQRMRRSEGWRRAAGLATSSTS